MSLFASLLDFSLAFGKILGAFPYTNPNTEGISSIQVIPFEKKSSDESTDRYGNHNYKKTSWGKLWQMCVVLFFCAYVFLTGWSFFLYKDFLGSKTELTITMIEDIINLITSFLITLYFMCKTQTTLKVVGGFIHLLEHCAPKEQTRTHGFYFASYILAYLTGAALSLVNIVTSIIHFYRLHEVPELIFNVIINCFVMSFYWPALYLIASCYDNIYNELAKLNKDFGICQNTSSGLTKADVINHPTGKHANEIAMKDVKKSILEIQEYQKRLNSHMAFPMSVILSVSIPGCILYAFYILTKHTEDIDIEFYCGFLVSSIVPLLVFPNLPVAVLKKVEEVKLLVNRLRRQGEFRAMREELMELKEILEESPGFELCHTFTLGRPRILDIFSYVATYLVILLQFRITEGGKKTNEETTNWTTSTFQNP